MTVFGLLPEIPLEHCRIRRRLHSYGLWRAYSIIPKRQGNVHSCKLADYSGLPTDGPTEYILPKLTLQTEDSVQARKFDTWASSLEDLAIFYAVRHKSCEYFVSLWKIALSPIKTTKDVINDNYDEDVFAKLEQLKVSREFLNRSESKEDQVDAASAQQSEKLSPAMVRFNQVSSLASSVLQGSGKVEVESNLKNACLKLRMSINRKIGQIACDKDQISIVVHDLLILLNDIRVKEVPGLHDYCLLTMAKKLVVSISCPQIN